MKKNINHLFLPGFILLLSCGSSNVERKTTEPVTATAPGANQQGDGIVGSWKEQAFTSDDNGNYQLDDDERKRAKPVDIIEVYLKVNANGSCSLTGWTNKGHYELKTEGERKKIYIYDDASGEDNHFAIISVNKTELVLLNYTSGALHIYKRI